MYQTITKCDFHDAFQKMGRNENFTYDARCALYYYLIDGETEHNQIELDVIALCCEYTEDTIKNTLEEYNLNSIEELEENTTVVWKDDERVLYLNY
jgi:hypothetical protein